MTYIYKPDDIKLIRYHDLRAALDVAGIDVNLSNIFDDYGRGVIEFMEIELIDPDRICIEDNDPYDRALWETVTNEVWNAEEDVFLTTNGDFFCLEIFLSWMKYHGLLDCSYHDNLAFKL